ncbi:hypothetical protein D3C78_1393780 [compost metagenome]
MKSFSVSAPFSMPELAVMSGSGRLRPTPGFSRLTITRPSISDTSDAVTNQPIALAPMRPTVAESPMRAMPTTRVENTSGAMIILIRRRKTSVRMDRLSAKDLMASGLPAISRQA